MNKRVQTYNDLLAEKQRLTELLEVHRELIKLDVEELKEQVKPVSNMISLAGKLFGGGRTSTLLGLGVDLSIDVLLKKIFKSNRFARILLPGLMKNMSSGLLSAASKSGWLQSILSFFKHKKDQPKVGTEAVFNQ